MVFTQDMTSPLGSYLKKIEYLVTEDNDLLYMIVGLTVINGLQKVNINTSSKKELAYREMKTVYAEMEITIDACKQNNSYERFKELKKIVSEMLIQESTSSLLTKMVIEDSMPQESVIWQFGKRIMEITQYSGIEKQNKETTLKDYRTLCEML